MVVRSEEYPFYSAVWVAACKVSEEGSYYEEEYVEAEHTAVYGTLLCSYGKKASAGSHYPSPEDECTFSMEE